MSIIEIVLLSVTAPIWVPILASTAIIKSILSPSTPEQLGEYYQTEMSRLDEKMSRLSRFLEQEQNREIAILQQSSEEFFRQSEVRRRSLETWERQRKIKEYSWNNILGAKSEMNRLR